MGCPGARSSVALTGDEDPRIPAALKGILKTLNAQRTQHGMLHPHLNGPDVGALDNLLNAMISLPYGYILFGRAVELY